MNTKSRITSIVNTHSLAPSVTGLPTFDLSQLDLPPSLDFTFPTNVRLGHIAEKIVAKLIKASTNYRVLFENVQLIENKQTIGEIDFILEEVNTAEVIHMELAYKFYLYDPSISSEPISNWIGPNRNDSLIEKLDKLKTKQFPLLHHPCAAAAFDKLDLSEVSQALCLLVSLFLPYESKEHLSPHYAKTVKGYYLNFAQFKSLYDQSKSYCIPAKKEWGIAPSVNENWTDYTGIVNQIRQRLDEKQAPLVWQKQNDSYLEFFIVWW